ncbi:MAG: lysophospholipid acyltransferase family protein [Cyclobacteriaceae bacterium]|jgi:KDO2-lipid IV(A) lauroyltransferase|nr:lysophospholipid acyltransferase family protein [Cyclobacteriaceae bacterium]
MVLLRLLSYLPLWFLYRVSDALFVLAYYVVKYRRQVVYRNLKNAFPHKTPDELRGIERQFYQSLCDYAVETLKLLTIAHPELEKRVVYTNREVIGANTPHAIFLASHQFNWEWLLASGSFSFPIPVDFVYQRQSSGVFNAFSLAGRTRFGAHPILRQHVAREAIKRKHLPRIIAIVADQFPSGRNDKRYWTTFLHQETAFFQGISQLAVITQYPVYYLRMRKIARGYYEATLELIGTPPYAKEGNGLVEAYVRATERVISDYPHDWLWSHKRWKRSRKEMGE